MNTAKKINYRTQAAYELAKSVPCPRRVNDVYAMGANLQYCIRAKYLEIGDPNQKDTRALCTKLVSKQMDIKKQIEKAGQRQLNLLIQSFYEQGGPIMEDPVSEQMVKEINPFFNRLMSNFLDSLDEVTDKVSQGEMSVADMETQINRDIISMFSALGNLFAVDEMRDAFHELVQIRESF
jgi:hypothetical protein